MKFSTIKKRKEIHELFPNDAVLTQFANTDASDKTRSTFKLNLKAMNDFGFRLNTANINKIANGYDEDTNSIVLAAMDTNDSYTSNVTAKHTFSSLKFLQRLVSTYNIDATQQHHFKLDIIESEGVKYAYVSLMDSTEVEVEEDDTIISEVTTVPTDDLVLRTPQPYNSLENILQQQMNILEEEVKAQAGIVDTSLGVNRVQNSNLF